MEYFELRNKLFFPVRRKLINDYQMGTLDFERCEQLVNDLILKIGQYMDTGVPQDESTTGRSDSIDEAAGRRCTIKSKEELLIEEANALDSLFMSMKIEDISIEIRDNQLVAFDSDGNKWVENEIFDFALNECLTFGADGHLIDGYCVNEELLDQILHYAAQRDVKIERIPL